MEDHNLEKFIETIVESFYKKAVVDIFIGYHFRNIGLSHHLPRINAFWNTQLLGHKIPPKIERFLVFEKHTPLRIKKGELNRWVLLFNQTLDEYKNEQNAQFIDDWKDKVTHFQTKFLDFYFKDKQNHP